jgi:hypothetical protein
LKLLFRTRWSKYFSEIVIVVVILTKSCTFWWLNHRRHSISTISLSYQGKCLIINLLLWFYLLRQIKSYCWGHWYLISRQFQFYYIKPVFMLFSILKVSQYWCFLKIYCSGECFIYRSRIIQKLFYTFYWMWIWWENLNVFISVGDWFVQRIERLFDLFHRCWVFALFIIIIRSIQHSIIAFFLLLFDNFSFFAISHIDNLQSVSDQVFF